MGGPALMSRIFPPPGEGEVQTKSFPAELPEPTLAKLDQMVEWQAEMRGKKRLSRSWVLQWIVDWAYDIESRGDMKPWLEKRDRKGGKK